MPEKLKTIQEENNFKNGKVREFGIDDFIFNAKIHVYKKSFFCQKTKVDEVKSLVTRKKHIVLVDCGWL